MRVAYTRISRDLPPVTRADSGSLPDLRSRISVELKPEAEETCVVPLNVRIELPPGHFGVLYLRSSLAVRGVVLSGGIIDNSFRWLFSVGKYFNSLGPYFSFSRGELCAVLRSTKETVSITRGDRIVQLLVVADLAAEWDEVLELSQTERGSNGFGSTGRT